MSLRGKQIAGHLFTSDHHEILNSWLIARPEYDSGSRTNSSQKSICRVIQGEC